MKAVGIFRRSLVGIPLAALLVLTPLLARPAAAQAGQVAVPFQVVFTEHFTTTACGPALECATVMGTADVPGSGAFLETTQATLDLSTLNPQTGCATVHEVYRFTQEATGSMLFARSTVQGCLTAGGNILVVSGNIIFTGGTGGYSGASGAAIEFVQADLAKGTGISFFAGTLFFPVS